MHDRSRPSTSPGRLRFSTPTSERVVPGAAPAVSRQSITGNKDDLFGRGSPGRQLSLQS
jgi:hypothetical protein